VKELSELKLELDELVKKKKKEGLSPEEEERLAELRNEKADLREEKKQLRDKEADLQKKEGQLRNEKADLRKEKMLLLDKEANLLKLLLQEGNASVVVGELVDDCMRIYARPVNATCPLLAYEVVCPSFEAFKSSILKPVKTPKACAADVEGCEGWSQNGEPLALTVLDAQLVLRIQNAIDLVSKLEGGAFERDGKGKNPVALGEHTLDCTIHSALVLGPWSEGLMVDKDLVYGSDQLTQGEVFQAMMFEVDKSGKVRRWNVKPDSFLYYRAHGKLFLLTHSEHKADSASDLKKAMKTALTQFYFLKQVFKDDPSKIVVPFLTIERRIASLYCIFCYGDGNPRYNEVGRWDVSNKVEALNLVAAMFRLVDWAQSFGKEMVWCLPRELNLVSLEDYEKVSYQESSKSASSNTGNDSSTQVTTVPRRTNPQRGAAPKKTVGQEHAGVVEFLKKEFGTSWKEVYVRGMPCATWDDKLQRSVAEIEKSPWHFVVGSKWMKVFGSGTAEEGLNEVENLQVLNESGVVGVPKLLGHWELANGCVAVLMENCGKSLRFLGSWKELERRALELVETLSQVHALGRVHGDVKGSNLCAAPGERLKVTDWEGGACFGELARRYTDGYRAPETRLKEGKYFSGKSDVYSAGVTIEKWVKDIAAKDSDAFLESFWSEIVSKMTAEEEELRWSAGEVLEKLGRMKRKDDVPTKGSERGAKASHVWAAGRWQSLESGEGDENFAGVPLRNV